MQHDLARTLGILGAGLLLFGAVSACGDANEGSLFGSVRGPLTAECVPGDAAALPEGSWLCPNPKRMECVANQERAPSEVIFVEPRSPDTCDALDLHVAPGPFPVGTHEIVVSDVRADGGMREVCRAELTVVDTTAPVVTRHEVSLWPPNHRMQAVDIEDCITVHDACDPRLSARFLWAKSDESADARGDGHTEPDMRFASCTSVELRQERSGRGDGRVYQLGWLVTDQAGNGVQGVCRVTVPHDQGDGGAGKGPAWGGLLTAPHCGS